jgi:hypothetical protein
VYTSLFFSPSYGARYTYYFWLLLLMYIVVQAHDDSDGQSYGAVGGVKRVDQLRNARNRSMFSGRAAGIIGSTICLVAVAALALSSSGDAPVEEESSFTGSIMKYNPITGLLKTKYADPGLYTRVWWGKDVSWSDLQGSWPDVKDSLGDPKIRTFIPTVNFPRASTLSLLGQPFPKPGTNDFNTLVCLWKGRFEIVKEGKYNLTLTTNSDGAYLNISGETVIVNSDGGDATLTDFKLAGGFHPIEILWRSTDPNDKDPVPRISEYHSPCQRSLPP